MSKLLGNAVLIFSDNVAIGCTTTGSVTIEGQEIETTCKDNNGAYTSVIGTDRWTAEAGGIWDTEATVGVPELLAIKLAKSLIGFKMAVVNPETGNEVSGGTFFQGYARIQSITINSDLNNPAAFTVSFSGQGTWSYGTTT